MLGAFCMSFWMLAVIQPQLVVGSHLVEAQGPVGDPFMIGIPFIICIIVFIAIMKLDKDKCPDLDPIADGSGGGHGGGNGVSGGEADPKDGKSGVVGQRRTFTCADGTTLSTVCTSMKTWSPNPTTLTC